MTKSLKEGYILDAFWIDQTEVTNAMFTRFVEETSYRTEAEIKGSAYLVDLTSNSGYEVEGASWWSPNGPGSNLAGSRGESRHFSELE